MSRSEGNISPADMSVTHESADADASPSSRVIMIHKSRQDSLDSRDLPGQHSHSNMDKVFQACLSAILCTHVDGSSAYLDLVF